MDQARQWYDDKVVQAILRSLNINGFRACHVASGEEASKIILGMIPLDAAISQLSHENMTGVSEGRRDVEGDVSSGGDVF